MGKILLVVVESQEGSGDGAFDMDNTVIIDCFLAENG